MKDIFDIEKFNIFSDSENYYFFRALNNGDNSDIENEITTDIDGNIVRVRVDRKRFKRIPRYNDSSIISLEEVFDHIKMQNSKETNCISLTSNANAALDYGRRFYKDTYVMVKVPKEELGKSVYTAGLYMLEEVNSKINELISSGSIDSETLSYLDKVDNITDLDELTTIIDSFKETTYDNDMFKKGINYIKPDAVEVLYQTLDEKQNLEKNKLVAKLHILNRNIYPNIGNKILLQTIGNAFSSMELIHYGDILKDEIIDVPKEVVDMLALLQQLPKDNIEVSNLRKELLNHILSNDKLTFEEFKYSDYKITDEISIEDMFNLTGGSIDYYSASNVYKKSFYLAKSKLRAKHIAKLLHKLTLNDDEYNALINYIENNCYGIEYQIISRQNNKGYNISESVNLDINNAEIELLNGLSKYSDNILSYIVENPKNALTNFLNNLSYLPRNPVDKSTYYANAILDMFDLKSLKIDSFTVSQRSEIIDKLKEIDCVTLYNYLKQNNVKEKDISRIIFVMMVKGKDLSSISPNESISIDELEDYLGYYEVKGTSIKLRDYQASAVERINKTFETKKFTSAILPTGAGKSFVALSEMLQYKDKEILYLAPNDEILNQIKRNIINYIHGTKGTTGAKNYEKAIRKTFPNLRLATYSTLSNSNDSEAIINHNYDLIVFDELHRTGASKWSEKVESLLEYQNDNVKVLGITATPVRDVDGIDMSDTMAKKLGYTEKEIKEKRHLSSNMSLIDAIKLGIVVNPKVINCEYTLTRSGETEKILEKINEIIDEEKRNDLLQRFDSLRRQLENSEGIPEILNEYLKQGGKYIVFLPVTRKDDGTYEDEDGNPVSSKKAEGIIKSYQNQMKQYIFIQKYLSDNEILYQIYNKIKSGVLLTNDDIAWLEKEKENILLLSKIKTIKERDVLDTKQNDMADLIIKTMNWSYLEESTKGKLLNAKTKEYIHAYSMLGSYGKDTNDKELLGFEKDKTNKYKFMFVMNKLNEGTHVSDINGLIWFRALDENSYILYMQQLGRIIYSLDPTKEYKDEDRTLAIDLTNNTLRVNMSKTKKEKESDLLLLEIVIDWMQMHSDKVPDINSYDRKESKYASILKRIKEKYSIYLDSNEFDKLSDNEKEDVEDILRLGSMIGLWNITFEDKVRTTNIKETDDDLLELFELTPILRDFYELEQNANEVFEVDIEKRIHEIYEVLIDEGKLPSIGSDPRKFKDGGTTYGSWLGRKKQKIIGKSSTNKEAKAIVEAAGWLKDKKAEAEELFNARLLEIYEVLIDEGKLPSIGSDQRRFKDNGSTYGRWLKKNKQKIINKSLTNKEAKAIVEAAGWLKDKEKEAEELFMIRLSEIYEVLIDEGKLPSIGSDQRRFKDNGSTYGNWLTVNKQEIIGKSSTNKESKAIVEAAGWLKDKEKEAEELFNARLSEIYKVLIDEGKLPSRSDPRRFEDGGTIYGRWLSCNTQKIIDKSLTNKEAKAIVEAAGWLKDKEKEAEELFMIRLSEIYEVLIGEGKLPSRSDPRRFKDNGSTYASWLKLNTQKIIEKSLTNKEAKAIVEAAGWLKDKEKEAEELFNARLSEMYEVLIGEGKLPSRSDPRRFKDNGSTYGNWLKENKQKIINKSLTNKEAYEIAYSAGWLIFSDSELYSYKHKYDSNIL